MRYGRFCTGAAVSALMLGAGFTPAKAQGESQAVSAAGLETVIVTARKRPEMAQTVPIAITAFDQNQLDRLDIRTIDDLKFAAPSVYVAPTTFRQDTLNVTIRGQRDFELEFRPGGDVVRSGRRDLYGRRLYGPAGGPGRPLCSISTIWKS